MVGQKLNLQLDLITDLTGGLKRYQYWTLKCLSYWKETINQFQLYEIQEVIRRSKEVMKLLLVMEIDLGLRMYIMAKGLSLIAPSKPGK